MARRSDHDGARARYEEALALYRQVGAVLGEANCHFSTGRSWAAEGVKSRAAAEYQKALAYYTAHGDPYPIGAAHFLWASICEGEARETHRREARQAWSGLDRQDLTGMAASDGIGSADLEALFRADK